eukprot:3812571-Lingulodinium_polyedra.AAC.1
MATAGIGTAPVTVGPVEPAAPSSCRKRERGSRRLETALGGLADAQQAEDWQPQVQFISAQLLSDDD